MTRQAPCWIQLCITALLVLMLHKVESKRFLGIAAIGSRSHQFCMLRVGQELASRGHHFTFLVSDQEDMGLKHLGTKAFPGLEVVEFAGPPDVGTQDWFTRFSRDVMAILRSFQTDMIAAAHHLYNDKATLHKLSHAGYDVLLKDGVYWPASVLSEVLNLTVVDVLSMGPAQPLLGQPCPLPTQLHTCHS
ncbi:TPA: hypothetical protein ACH3X2_008133 [Trebouxia sp. C0005]